MAMLLAQSPAKSTRVETDNRLVQGLLSNRPTGDVDSLIRQRLIKVLVIHNRADYFLDRGKPHGLAYETAEAFKTEVNRRHGRPRRPV
jgi:membrane-bound lytic murein transglycosylase MltF